MRKWAWWRRLRRDGLKNSRIPPGVGGRNWVRFEPQMDTDGHRCCARARWPCGDRTILGRYKMSKNSGLGSKSGREVTLLASEGYIPQREEEVKQ